MLKNAIRSRFFKHHRAGVRAGVRGGVRGGVANTMWLVLGKK